MEITSTFKRDISNHLEEEATGRGDLPFQDATVGQPLANLNGFGQVYLNIRGLSAETASRFPNFVALTTPDLNANTSFPKSSCVGYNGACQRRLIWYPSDSSSPSFVPSINPVQSIGFEIVQLQLNGFGTYVVLVITQSLD